ncbi:hypothetical protein BDP27DRAFT_1368076 [Rhodocollybia butyracea]|uniref:Ubiquitin-like protease family profile domain-containing protein n=1 Tax=Rhodocollybia butyracea TaxID=206335 RepID=A0A9P5PIP0_9AGAR|nr:hypothetical protein BDP27DRAFT_1368076 [Rhodocollybia butyracea]
MKDNSTVSSGAQRQNSKNETPSRFNFKQNTLRKLPLKELFFGLKYLPEGYDIVFRPYSKSQANGFSIKGPANYIETITFAQSVENVAIGGISVSVDPCVKFTIKALDPRIPHRTLFPGIGAPGCRGTVTVKFDTRHNRWSEEAFNEFQFLCKKAAQHYSELVGPAANNSVWNEVLDAAGVSLSDLVVNEEPNKAESFEHQSRREISGKTSGIQLLSSFKFKKIKQTNLATFNLPSLPEAESPHIVDKPAVQDIHTSTKRRKISTTQDIQSTRTFTTVDGTPAIASKTRDVTTKPGLNLPRPVEKHRGTTIPLPRVNTATSGRPKSSHIDKHDMFVFYVLHFLSRLISPSALEHSPTGMKLEKSDLNRIPTGWFNDNLINFLLKLWHYELLLDKPALANQIHVFNSWFYQNCPIHNEDPKSQMHHVGTVKLIFFSKRFLIVPINEWTLILIMDSLGSSQARAVEILGNYLQTQGEEKKNTGNLKCPSSRVLQVPQQPNYIDCGVYLLHFVRVFVEKVENLINVSNTRPLNEVDTDWEGARLKGLREEFGRKMDDLCASWRAEEQREKETPQDWCQSNVNHSPFPKFENFLGYIYNTTTLEKIEVQSKFDYLANQQGEKKAFMKTWSGIVIDSASSWTSLACCTSNMSVNHPGPREVKRQRLRHVRESLKPLKVIRKRCSMEGRYSTDMRNANLPHMGSERSFKVGSARGEHLVKVRFERLEQSASPSAFLFRLSQRGIALGLDVGIWKEEQVEAGRCKKRLEEGGSFRGRRSSGTAERGRNDKTSVANLCLNVCIGSSFSIRRPELSPF